MELDGFFDDQKLQSLIILLCQHKKLKNVVKHFWSRLSMKNLRSMIQIKSELQKNSKTYRADVYDQNK